MLRPLGFASLAACAVILACTAPAPPPRVITTRVEPVASNQAPEAPSPARAPQEVTRAEEELDGESPSAELSTDFFDQRRAFQLVVEFGKEACSSEPDADARKGCQDALIGRALNEVEMKCDAEPEEQRTPCMVRKLLEKYGP